MGELGYLGLRYPEALGGADADMVLPGLFGTSWLVLTDRRVAVFSPDHGDTTRLLDLPLGALVKVRRRELQGSNLLEAHTADGALPLVRFTDARADAIDQVAEAIRSVGDLFSGAFRNAGGGGGAPPGASSTK